MTHLIHGLLALSLALAGNSRALPEGTLFRHVGTVERVIVYSVTEAELSGQCSDGTAGAIVVTNLPNIYGERWIHCAETILCECSRLREGERVLMSGTVVGGYNPANGRESIVFVGDRLIRSASRAER